MNKKDRIFLFIFIALFVGYLVVEYTAPKPLDWRVTFHEHDKNPFGGFVLNERLEDIFSFSETSHLTFPQLANQHQNILILAEEANLTETDIQQLHQILASGRHVLLAAHQLPKPWLDSLGLEMSFEFDVFNEAIFDSPAKKISLKRTPLSAGYPAPMLPSYFEVKKTNAWEVLATDEAQRAIAIRWQRSEEGQLILCSSPLIFSNLGLLHNDNYTFSQEILKLLPPDAIHLSYFYQLGRPEPQTPLRYVLTQAALRWAVYLSVALLLIMFIFETRRKQRKIPVLTKPENTTVAYVKTLGNLYFQQRDNKNLAEKMIRHFIHRVHEKYHLTFQHSERFYELLSVRSEVPVSEVADMCESIQRTREQQQISGNDLLALAEKINRIL